MKLKFICAPASGNGGTETVLVEALNYLVKTYQIELFLTTIPKNRLWLDKMNQKIQIHELKNESRINKLIYLASIFFNASSQDHFIILSVNSIKLASQIRRLTHKHYTITSWIHYSLINQKMFDPNNIKFADNHWAISTPIKQQLMNLGIKEKSISLIFNPIDCYIGKLNIPKKDNVIRIVYVGKIMLDGQKNLRELFDGLKLFNWPIHLDLFGADNSNGEVYEYVKMLGISDKCTFHGWKRNPWNEILNDIHPDALILTSKYEGLPMVMIEGMSRGIPCIVADFSGYEDIMEIGENGYVYKSGNQQDLKEKLLLLREKGFDAKVISKSVEKFNSENYYLRINKALKEGYYGK